MLTLYELKELLGDAVDNWKDDTPRPSVLRNSGVGIMTDTVVDDDTLLEVYENGLVLYETDLHHTVFPIRKLGYPAFICILESDNQHTIAIKPCEDNVMPSFKVLEGIPENRQKKFRIYSQGLVLEIMDGYGLEKGRRYIPQYLRKHSEYS